PFRLVAEIFSADPGALRQLRPAGQDAVRLRLAGDHARPLAGGFCQAGHPRRDQAKSIEGQCAQAPKYLEAPSKASIPVTIQAVVFDAYGTLYDIQSVAAITEEAFPGYGEIITQIWRIKQLEYTWLRSLMRRYEDFSVITKDSLAYTIRVLGLKHDAATFERIMDKYLHLDLYPDALATLGRLKGKKLAILSNGSSGMLNTLVGNTGLDRILDA